MAYIGKAPGGTGVRQRYLYTATSGQTTFTTSDSGLALSYSDTNYMDVYQNGVLLDPANDYTATSGTSVVLGTGATTGDVIEIIVYDVFSVFNNTVTGNFTVGNNLTVSGTSTLATVDINAGNIDGTTIGAATPAAGTFTTGDFNTSLNVDGTITSDGLTVDGSSVLNNDSSSIATVLELRNDDKTDDNGLRLDFNSLDTSNNDNVFGRIEVEIKNHATEKSNMNFSIRNDSGNFTELFVLDKDEKVIMNGSVGIGESNPDRKLHVKSGADNVVAKFESTDAVAAIEFADSAGSAEIGNAGNDLVFYPAGIEKVRIDSSGNLGIGESNPAYKLDVASAVIQFGDSTDAFAQYKSSAGNWHVGANSSNAFAFYSGTYGSGSERMRIDSSGNLLVGQSSTTVPGLSNTTTGLSLTNNGYIFASKADDNVAWFNRNTSDGSIISLRKDGSPVGSIGTNSSRLTIGNGDTGLLIAGDLDNITPFNTSTNASRDAAVDLGNSGVRFKDLYLSGSVYLGGTGSANALNDYEEGTWTPSYTAQTSNPTIDYNRRNGNYVKIGKLVKATVELRTNSISGGSGTLYISGLPFTANSPAAHTRAGTMNVGYSNDFTTLAPQSGIIDDGNTFAIPFVNNSSDARVGIDQALTVSNLTNGTGQNYLIATIIYETD